MIFNFFHCSLECPLNYILYNGRCYRFEADGVYSWDDARDQCEKEGEGFDFVVINDSEENKFIMEKIENEFNQNQFWIGLKENDKDDDFDWVDGSELSYTNWKSNGKNEVMNNSLYA